MRKTVLSIEYIVKKGKEMQEINYSLPVTRDCRVATLLAMTEGGTGMTSVKQGFTGQAEGGMYRNIMIL